MTIQQLGQWCRLYYASGDVIVLEEVWDLIINYIL